MKKILPILTMILMTIGATAQIVINEISYNPPEGGTDSLEYIELYNLGVETVDLEGYSFSEGVTLTFPAGSSIAPDGYLLVNVDNAAMMAVFGVSGVEWESGGLSNSGESIVLIDADGVEVDAVEFDDADPWPTDGTDGEGGSIELCDATSDNSLGESWRVANNDSGMEINGAIVYGTPGAANTVSCAAEPDVLVDVSGLTFTPADITIQIGETVRWENTSGNHNVNGSLDAYPDNPEGFLSGDPAPAPWTYEYTFNEPGFYNYQCDLHVGAGMVGTVTVEGEVEPLPSLVISEINYNDPAQEDSLEYLEIVNVGSDPINLAGITFTSGVEFTFPDMMILSGEYLVIAQNSDFLMDKLGVQSLQWESGALSNGGELIEMATSNGAIIDAVEYDDSGDWPELADGLGYSLTLCDINSDNSLASSWAISTNETAADIDGVNLFANPGQADRCAYSVAEVTMIDADGVITFSGDALLSGTVYGVNLRPGGLQFTLIDDAGDGISVFNDNDNLGYTLQEGDNVSVEGMITQFNGLAQINIDAINLISSGNTLMNPAIVTTLDESTESQLVTLENVHVVDPNEWNNSGSGFNVRVTDGSSDTLIVRIDADVDLYDKGYPQGTFSVTGIGGQFDNSVPHTDGYQLLPRYTADISPYDEFIIEFPAYDIATVTTNDSEGVADSLGRKALLTGVVHSINFRPSGLQFWLIDDNNDGILIFNFNDNLGYTVAMGDEVEVTGTIDQFNGVTELIPTSITVLSSGNDLVTKNLITSPFTEVDESTHVTLGTVSMVDETEWLGDGSSFAIQMTDGTNTFDVFIDSDTEFASMPLPPATVLEVSGVINQSDNTSPFTSGYSLWVRNSDDLVVVDDVIDLDDFDQIAIYPNPASSILLIDTDLDIEKITVTDLSGKIMYNSVNRDSYIDLQQYQSGMYLVNLFSGGNQYIKRVIKL